MVTNGQRMNPTKTPFPMSLLCVVTCTMPCPSSFSCFDFKSSKRRFRTISSSLCVPPVGVACFHEAGGYHGISTVISMHGPTVAVFCRAIPLSLSEKPTIFLSNPIVDLKSLDLFACIAGSRTFLTLYIYI